MLQISLQWSFVVVVVVVEFFAAVFVSGSVAVDFDAGTADAVVIAVVGVVRWTSQI